MHTWEHDCLVERASPCLLQKSNQKPDSLICTTRITDALLLTLVSVFVSSTPGPVVCQWLERYQPTTVCASRKWYIHPLIFDFPIDSNARYWARCCGMVCKPHARENKTTRQPLRSWSVDMRWPLVHAMDRRVRDYLVT